MSLQTSIQFQAKLIRFAKFNLLLIEAAIVTSAIGAIALTQPSVAQERPGSVSTSARDLGATLEANCRPINPDGIPEVKPSFCGGVGLFEGGDTDTVVYSISTNPNIRFQRFDSTNLFDFMYSPVAAGFNPPQQQVTMISVPLF